ncbi:MAG: ABC transporter ATP-binding protein [Lachnospiraceae bacterium]
MAQLELRHIYKRFQDGVEAVKDFNMYIEEGEFIIFVGPSGCGKSTILRMIAGLEKITDGELNMDGIQVNGVESCDRNIAMVFQNYALYPHMSVFENIAYSMKLQKIPKQIRKKKVEEVAEMLGIQEILNRKPRELSGGQKQRVAMGRAIVRKPKIFLMDEPLSNLDAKLRNQVRQEIVKLYQTLKTTFIYVTHDQVEAMTLGTRVVVLKDGEIQQVAVPKELYERPVNKFVASFIGTPQMNFIEGKCIREEERVYIQIGLERLTLTPKMGKELCEKRCIGKQVLVGVRPEDVKLCEKADLELTVNVYEMLGAEAFIYFNYQGVEMSAKVSPDSNVERGNKIKIQFDVERIHLFDLYTEQRII